MLKWDTDNGLKSKSLRVTVRTTAGISGYDATPADLIAALKANAAACGEVTAAMGWVTDQALAVTGERAEQAERSLATVTAERDAAKYWLAAHKAASEALVDPVTGHGFFMLIGKGDDGADGWFYTFGGPLDSYTLCERSDDQDPHFVYFQRERYDHDQGCWIDGCEVVEPVLAPDECSVAPYCLEAVTEERDALRHEAEAEVKVLRAQLAKTARERDDAMTLAEERRDYARAQNAKLSVECDDLRAQLTAVERERDEWAELWATSSRLCDEAQARADRALGITPGERGAAIAAGHTSGTPDASSARVAGASPRGQDSTPEPAGSSCPACKGTGYLPANYEITGMTGTYRPWSPCPLCAPRPEPDPESPATRREVEELRRQVERLEGLTGFGPEE